MISHKDDENVSVGESEQAEESLNEPSISMIGAIDEIESVERMGETTRELEAHIDSKGGLCTSEIWLWNAHSECTPVGRKTCEMCDHTLTQMSSIELGLSPATSCLHTPHNPGMVAKQQSKCVCATHKSILNFIFGNEHVTKHASQNTGTLCACPHTCTPGLIEDGLGV